MSKLTPKKRGIESEIWIVDKNWYPIYKKDINQETSYDRLTWLIDIHADSIKPEVLNNIVELITSPHKSIESAQKEILQLLTITKQWITDLWYNVSTTSQVKIDENQIDKMI